MGEAVVREEELLKDIREIFEHSSGQLSVFNVTSRLKKKYHIGRSKKFVNGKKIRSLIMKIDGIEEVDTGSRFLRYRYTGELENV